MKKWLNDISRDINKGIRETKMNKPSLVLRYKWHQEFLELGLDKKQSFQNYVKYKTKIWRKSKKRTK
jgi:hypothetical protein